MNLTELKTHIKDYYGVEPDYPFEKYPELMTFRHPSNNKWFALAGTVDWSKFDTTKEGLAPFLNVKCEPIFIESLLKRPGFYPAYHMNKKLWVSVVLEGSVESEELESLLAVSFDLTR